MRGGNFPEIMLYICRENFREYLRHEFLYILTSKILPDAVVRNEESR